MPESHSSSITDFKMVRDLLNDVAVSPEEADKELAIVSSEVGVTTARSDDGRETIRIVCVADVVKSKSASDAYAGELVRGVHVSGDQEIIGG